MFFWLHQHLFKIPSSNLAWLGLAWLKLDCWLFWLHQNLFKIPSSNLAWLKPDCWLFSGLKVRFSKKLSLGLESRTGAMELDNDDYSNPYPHSRDGHHCGNENYRIPVYTASPLAPESRSSVLANKILRRNFQLAISTTY